MTIREYLSQSAITGGITDGCSAVDMLNAARQLLYPLDDWTGTVAYGCVRTNNSCFYIPSHIETIRKAWRCEKDIPIGNEGWYHLDANSLYQYCRDTIGVVRTDRSVVLPVGFPKDTEIGFLIQDDTDKGMKISVTAMNVFGSIVTSVLTLQDLETPVFAELQVRELLSISKPTTNGAIRVLSRCNRCISNIYLLEAYENNIKYWQYRAMGTCDCLVIKGKKKFFAYRATDLDREIDIENPTALQFASQAIEHLRNKRYQEHTDAIKLARTYLERTKEDLRKSDRAGVTAAWEPSLPVGTGYYGY